MSKRMMRSSCNEKAGNVLSIRVHASMTTRTLLSLIALFGVAAAGIEGGPAQAHGTYRSAVSRGAQVEPPAVSPFLNALLRGARNWDNCPSGFR